MPVTIALASAETLDGQTARNMSVMLDAMAEAAAHGVDMICFGESFLQGFNALTWRWEQDRMMAESVDGPVVGRLAEASAAMDIALAFGLIERDGEALYSTYLVLEGGRLLCRYRRMSRGWKEFTRTDGHYREGQEAASFLWHDRRLAVALCGDVWDVPDRFRLGEDVLLWPVYCSYTPEEWTGGTTEEYAAQCADLAPTTLMVNSLCPGDSAGGCFRFSAGRIAERLAPGEAGLLYCTLD